MDKELYVQIEAAEKFQGERATPIVSHAEQADTGMGWAARQQQRPEPEPIIQMKPIVPMA